MARHKQGTKKPIEADARAWLALAKDYCWAADALLSAHMATATVGASVIRPSINFLYSHTVEVCLKAVIRGKGGDVYETHDLPDLYEQATSLGLSIPEGDTIDETKLCLQALHGENIRQAFRYFDGNVGNSVDAVLVQPFVNRLLKATEDIVGEHGPEITSTRRKMATIHPGKIVPFTPEEQKAMRENPQSNVVLKLPKPLRR